MRYGWIGLGHLGAHLAASLVREGFALTVTDLVPGRAQALLDEGARWADHPTAVARGCDAVFTCLPSPAASEAVLAGPHGILAGLAPGGDITVRVRAEDGRVFEFIAIARIDTPEELVAYRHGGILPYVLRQLVQS